MVERFSNQNEKNETEKLEQQLKEAKKKYQELDKRYQNKARKLEELEEKWTDLEKSYIEITTSFYWRMTKPLRFLGTLLKNFPPLVWLVLFLKELRTLGLKPAGVRAWHRLTGQAWKDDLQIDLKFIMPNDKRRGQERAKFSTPFSFDLFVWLEDTPVSQIESFLQSMFDQTYHNWSVYFTVSHSNTAYEELERQTAQDKRIIWVKSESASLPAGLNETLLQSSGQFKMLIKAGDLLHPAALFECQTAFEENGWDMLYTDNAYFSASPSEPFDYHFKPDFSPVTLRGHNYIGDLVVFSEELMKKAGQLNEALEERSHYDWVLRLTEQSAKVGHIAKALYYTREASETRSPVSAHENQCMELALKAHLERSGFVDALIAPLDKPGAFHVRYPLKDEPLVSILIPNKDYINDLSACIQSVMEESTYRNFEIIIIENNSTDPKTFAYYEEIQEKYETVKVVHWKGIFNYSAINNFGATYAKGQYLLLLNNDVEIISPGWIEEMLGFVQQDKVGAVGAMLYYPDDTIQHAGVTVGVLGVGGHAHKDFLRGSEGYHNRLLVAQNVSCVTAACMLLPKKVFDQVGGLNEAFEVSFNDVDLCMKIIAAGYDIVFNPFVELYHFESKSRGTDEAPEKRKRFLGEVALFQKRWDSYLKKGDPYYNKNLTLNANDFSLKYNGEG